MLDGIYFQFPKLGFLLFFFLACETLCPLRSNPLYFPNTAKFGEVGVKPSLWMWISKWAMIILFIIALMSPVRDKEIAYSGGGGYDILFILDPAMIDAALTAQVSALIDKRPDDAIALWVPGISEVIVPLTYEHNVLKSILSHVSKDEKRGVIDTSIRRFFNVSRERAKWVVIISRDPKLFVSSLPKGVESSIAPINNLPGWFNTLHRDHPALIRPEEHLYVNYYYIYPLFVGFMAMLVYLYGRNQKGLK